MPNYSKKINEKKLFVLTQYGKQEELLLPLICAG
jgi:hypothetical protein